MPRTSGSSSHPLLATLIHQKDLLEGPLRTFHTGGAVFPASSNSSCDDVLLLLCCPQGSAVPQRYVSLFLHYFAFFSLCLVWTLTFILFSRAGGFRKKYICHGSHAVFDLLSWWQPSGWHCWQGADIVWMFPIHWQGLWYGKCHPDLKTEPMSELPPLSLLNHVAFTL